MEESRKYEPLRLKPCLRSYLWGGTRLREEYHKTGAGVIAESWELSVRADGPTYIDSGAHCGESLADVLRADPVGMAGTRCGVAPFPLLIKLIDAQKDLSVQVHPSDASACREKGEQGKTEMWYVVDCKPESTLFLGFSRAVTPDELRRRAKDGTICEVLNRVAVHPGDVFFVRPGTVHAIGAGILVAEIQQNSDTTFRVYDYNRLGADGKPRQLHLERAIEVMNCAPAQGTADTLLPCPPDGVQEVLTCEYFRVRRAEVKRRIDLSTEGGSFTHLMCVRGGGDILCGGRNYPFRQGDSYFLPAALGEYAVEGDCSLLLSSV
ncbi:MAG: type I phosphomannose isomerase catalytic subunit [Oscillospiraceae bacterium]